jgi:hypothetical protein
VFDDAGIDGSAIGFRNRRLDEVEEDDEDGVFGVVETKTRYSDFPFPFLRLGLNSIDDGPDKPILTKKGTHEEQVKKMSDDTNKQNRISDATVRASVQKRKQTWRWQ